MKRIVSIILTIILVLGLCACGQDNAAAWQEKYDLGVKYLSEGNYEEAIIAFTAAIEIDAKRPECFIGRGDAYALSGDTEDNLSAAQADYETAIALDETMPGGWLGLADVYIRRGDYEKAMEILREALEKTGSDESIADKLAEMEIGTYADSANNIRRENTYDMSGELISYTVYDYDDLSRRCGWENYEIVYENEYSSGEFTLKNYCEVDFDSQNRPERNRFYDSDGILTWYDTFLYNDSGLKYEQHRYDQAGNENSYFLFYYDDQGRKIRYEGYNEDGMYSYWISEYDKQGNLIRETRYEPDGTQRNYSTVE